MGKRELISGHSPYEPVFGFSRAVRASDRVVVSGTAPVPADGSAPPPGAYDQAKLCLDLIAEALAKAGARLEDVVRTGMFLTGADHWPQVARAHGEVFGAIRPAATAVMPSSPSLAALRAAPRPVDSRDAQPVRPRAGKNARGAHGDARLP
jgi:enamine deaminase RidA (YjgF/YER057c/UK114 family)